MDQLFFEPGWKPTPKPELAKRVAAAISEDGGVFDGNNSGTLQMRLEKAHSLIWLDLPLWITFPRIIRRLVRNYGTVRPDMADGCPERFDMEFLRWAWTFPQHSRPRQEIEFEAFGKMKYRLASKRDISRFLRRIERTGTTWDAVEPK
ncbi:hypothetical protein U0C82_01915 [Fulvimarina sp. 2208YS6-2-32]|uniref:Adenylate kinase n=1 Tax=Fulvimarina uroteuthidis TaxID=3098149 RepID=A0ABU5HYL7_9HYPH|nr:hypothetical protein [Fulvimarina sp. 2208YS6-2-32]MDY8107905.1 hypothetical protein [Fulvimarina sp. 2208YS6-2-32]